VRAVARKKDMADALLLEKVAQRRITVAVVDHHILRSKLDAADNGDRQFPEAVGIVLRAGVEAWELFEIVRDGTLGVQTQSGGQRAALVGKLLERRGQLGRALLPRGLRRRGANRTIQLLANVVFLARQTVGNEADLASQRLQPRVNDLGDVLVVEAVLFGGAEHGDAGRLRRVPALAVVDAPG